MEVRTIIFLALSISSFAQSVLHYLPMNPGATIQTGKWTVANSGSDFLITNPDSTTSTVAKAAQITQSVTVFALPANGKIIDCVVKTGTAFTGTTTLTATLGTVEVVLS